MDSSEEIEYDIVKDPRKRRAERDKQYELLQKQESSSDEESEQEQEPNSQIEQDKADQENADEDDMFASDNEESKVEEKVEKPKKNSSNQYLDMDSFRREEQLGMYDEENDNKKSLKEEEELDDIAKESGIKYYTNAENWDSNISTDKSKLNVEVEAFDIKDDEEDGKFDADGNFIRSEKTDDGSNHDEWMKDVKSRDIEIAKAAQDKRERKQRENYLKSELVSTEIALKSLIDVLEPAESPLEALARLRPKGKNRKGPKTDEEKERRLLVFKITESCDVLIERGVSEVYDISREGLMRQFKLETGEDFQSSRGVKRSIDEVEPQQENSEPYYDDKKWEYKWDNEIQGPHSSYEMQYWSENYFDDTVTVRKIGETEFKRLDEVSFD